MKKIITLFLLVIGISLNCYSQGVGNNLHKSLGQIRQAFPNLVYLQKEKGYDVYKSAGEDGDFTCFYLEDGIVVGEYTYIFDYLSDNFIANLYKSLLNSFAKTNAVHKRNKSGQYDITYFYYSDYIVKIANYGDQLQLYYELDGYNINLNALQTRRPRY